MSPDQHRRIAALFAEAVGLPASARTAFVEAKCAGDPAARAELQALLRNDQAIEALGPIADARGTLEGRVIGDYEVGALIASGGLGSVYLAMQRRPRRSVALKVMRDGISSPRALKRFEYEAQLLARLRHPGIAQVYEAGLHVDHEGTVPFFAMEYVPRARALTDYAREHGLTARQRVDLAARVCDAVGHGHAKGVIHRDLKPSNIIVDPAGMPKVIDFGVAKATDSDVALATQQTSLGSIVGTIQYMSPEQFEGDSTDIDARSDVYSLGLVLYELLCGQLPYSVSGVPLHAAASVVRHVEPVRVGRINRELRGELEAIVGKAMEKSRERRYRTASDLGDDLRRYLAGEPIIARPPTVGYQLRKLISRHRVPALGAALLLALLLAFAVVVTILYRDAREAEGRAVVEREALRAERRDREGVQQFLQAADQAIAQRRRDKHGSAEEAAAIARLARQEFTGRPEALAATYLELAHRSMRSAGRLGRGGPGVPAGPEAPDGPDGPPRRRSLDASAAPLVRQAAAVLGETDLDHPRLVRIHCDVADALAEVGALSEADAMLERVLRFEGLGLDQRALAIQYRAGVAAAAGDRDRALELSATARELALQSERSDEGAVMRTLGERIHMLRGLGESPVDTFWSTIGLLRAQPQPRTLALAVEYGRLAEALRAEGRVDEAIDAECQADALIDGALGLDASDLDTNDGGRDKRIRGGASGGS